MFGKAFPILLCILAVAGMASALVAQQQTDSTEDQEEEWTWSDSEKRYTSQSTQLVFGGEL
jgi:hypothetical protein